MKDIRCIAQNASLFVSLLQNIFCEDWSIWPDWKIEQHRDKIREERKDQRKVFTTKINETFYLEGHKTWYRDDNST